MPALQDQLGTAFALPCASASACYTRQNHTNCDAVILLDERFARTLSFDDVDEQQQEHYGDDDGYAVQDDQSDDNGDDEGDDSGGDNAYLRYDVFLFVSVTLASLATSLDSRPNCTLTTVFIVIPKPLGVVLVQLERKSCDVLRVG